jgi:hypothetical protein
MTSALGGPKTMSAPDVTVVAKFTATEIIAKTAILVVNLASLALQLICATYYETLEEASAPWDGVALEDSRGHQERPKGQGRIELVETLRLY